jgi:hypothetical protein
MVVSSQTPDFIKTPAAMQYIDGLQRHLETLPVVGKTLSVADYVKRINRVVHEDKRTFETIPDDATTIGQYLFLFNMSAKPADLNNVVDYPFQQANVWVQLKTWDASAMEQVIEAAQAYRAGHPLAVEVKPAGTAYFNLVWNHEVLWARARCGVRDPGSEFPFLQMGADRICAAVVNGRRHLWGNRICRQGLRHADSGALVPLARYDR